METKKVFLKTIRIRAMIFGKFHAALAIDNVLTMKTFCKDKATTTMTLEKTKIVRENAA